MKITAYQNRQVLILSLALGLIFFGFNAAEQHFTAFYQLTGRQNLAFQALAILYGAIVVGNLIGPSIVRLIGIKSSLFLGYLAYVALVFGIVTKIPFLVYLLSALLGIGAGISGIARIDFLRLIAPVNQRGEYAGAPESLRTFGGFLGVVSVSLFLQFLNIDQTFILLGAVMLLGVGLMLFLKEVPLDDSLSSVSSLGVMVRYMVDPKILLLLPSGLAAGFLLGLVLGAIPAAISQNFGIEWVGIITSLFHLTLALILVTAGYWSDLKGRFIFIYGGMIVSILAVTIFLNFLTLPALILVMILLGLGGSLGGGAFSALMLDTFEKRVKEASATLNNLTIILGIVPAFLLPQFLNRNELFNLGIILTLLGILTLFIFQKLYD
ncbi:MFS transporter [Candidatus Daviesbacteria bacterium]|nr:MFS transporter [Candidatus Daviesbacteria bacterium]